MFSCCDRVGNGGEALCCDIVNLCLDRVWPKGEVLCCDKVGQAGEIICRD